jgi:hypothetical protein
MTRPTQDIPPISTHQTEPDQPAEIGNVPFALALLFTVLTLIPATRVAGTVLLLLLTVPAIVGRIRARERADGSRGITTATLVICVGMFFIGTATTPKSPQAAPTAAEASAPSPAVASAPPSADVAPPAAALAPPVPAPATVPPAVAPQQSVTSSAPAPVVVAAPVAPAPAAVPVPVEAAPPSVDPPPPVITPDHGSCGADDYTNVDHECVHRPEAAPSAPPGATAQCKDGEYSFSQHHQGTCSGHRGVKSWL